MELREADPARVHVPELDGLRGLAVLAVVAFHGLATFRGGWIGVDVFFVLSGFLITRLLLAERDRAGRVDLRAFYVRRLLRLAPALLLLLALTTPLLLGPLDHKLTVPPWLAVATTLGYASNWLQVFEPLSIGPLIHTWSLSVEEQFYLLWPPLLVLLLRRGTTRSRLAVRLALTAAALVAGTALLSRWLDPEPLGFATTTRGCGLLLGCLLAVRPVRVPAVAGWLAALLLAVATVTVPTDAAWLGRGGYALIALAAAALLGHLLDGGGVLAALCRWRPLRAVGAVSYGVYLFHYPVFQWVQDAGLPRLPAYLVEIGGTALVTALSWRYVERPALRWKERWRRAGVGGPAPREPATRPGS